jgi:CDP-glucose 4,6-dehydratase
MSTDKVYGAYDTVVDENFELIGTDHPYNASKLCADVLAQMYAEVYKLKIVIVRSGNIYGGGDKNFDRLIPGGAYALVYADTEADVAAIRRELARLAP